MRLLRALLLLAVLSFFFGPSFASDDILVTGTPPITYKAMHCHIRLIEFVLNTRLTIAQRYAFLQTIKEECEQMPQADRENFLSALELAESMQTMDQAGHEAVRFVLKKDYEETAKGLADDPSAKLYLQIQQSLTTPAVKIEEDVITHQSFMALIEYLQFLGKPDQPLQFSESEIEQIRLQIQQNCLKLSEEELAIIDDFEMTWHMIRGAWQNTAKNQIKDQVRAAAAALQMTSKPDFAKFRAALNAKFYGDLIDEAVELGFEPTEWNIDRSRDAM